jgi:hypothetical protein
MKKLLSFLFIFVLALSLISCKDKGKDENGGETGGNEQPIVTKHTVQFYVEDVLYKTLKIEEGKTIGEAAVEAPTLAGFEFVSWVDASKNPVDLATYEVKSALKLFASFKEVVTDDTLVVDGVKEEGKDYYLVVGWWETTKFEYDGVTPKITSSLTVDTVRVFYANLKLYLKACGATEDQLKSIQFRNYSSAEVAEMGAKVNEDADVDLLIGVGNNINSTAGVSLFEGNDGKQTAKMGTQGLSRYVALPNHEEMNNVAINVYDWIKTEVGQKSFTTTLAASDMVPVPGRTDEVNVNVKVYAQDGTFVETQLTNKNDEIQVPEVTLEEGQKFLGYALTEGATEAVILKSEITYKDIETLLAGATAIALYPVIVKEVINTEYDLVVYIHVAGSVKINLAEVELLKLRFAASLSEAKNINYVVVEGVDADGFKARIEADLQAGETIDVVIGGNKTTSKLAAINETYGNVSCNAKHFEDGSRKVIVLQQAASTHVELAQTLHSFLVAEPAEYKLHVAFWTKEYTWVTVDEIVAIKASIDTYLKGLFEVETELNETYNISVEYYETTKTAVVEISAETKAFNDGKGVGLIIGTGGNAANDTNMGSAIVEQKECPTNFVANDRKISLCEASFFYQALYNNHFIVAEQPEA